MTERNIQIVIILSDSRTYTQPAAVFPNLIQLQ